MGQVLQAEPKSQGRQNLSLNQKPQETPEAFLMINYRPNFDENHSSKPKYRLSTKQVLRTNNAEQNCLAVLI